MRCNPELGYVNLIDTISRLRNECFPTKTVRFNRYKHKIHPWLTSAILYSIKVKDGLYKRWKKSCNNPDPHYVASQELKFKTYNNNLRKIISLAKSNYYSSIFQLYKNDMRKTWSTLKSIICKNASKKQLPALFKNNDRNFEGDMVIANEFNKYFVNIGNSSRNPFASDPAMIDA